MTNRTFHQDYFLCLVPWLSLTSMPCRLLRQSLRIAHFPNKKTRHVFLAWQNLHSYQDYFYQAGKVDRTNNYKRVNKKSASGTTLTPWTSEKEACHDAG